MKRPVSTIRDYRATPVPTVERPYEADAHDREARALSKQTLIRAAEDLCLRVLPSRPNYKTDEGREAGWILGRKAALLREIRRRGLTPADKMP